jgi:beta-galactosidase GanA
LVVDGKPFLVLSGEWGNPTATTLENLKPLWEEAQQLHLNTITPALYWSQMEPVEGQFDFSLVDGMIQEAWRHNLRIAFVWFGSWKNSTSRLGEDRHQALSARHGARRTAA